MRATVRNCRDARHGGNIELTVLDTRFDYHEENIDVSQKYKPNRSRIR